MGNTPKMSQGSCSTKEVLALSWPQLPLLSFNKKSLQGPVSVTLTVLSGGDLFVLSLISFLGGVREGGQGEGPQHTARCLRPLLMVPLAFPVKEREPFLLLKVRNQQKREVNSKEGTEKERQTLKAQQPITTSKFPFKNKKLEWFVFHFLFGSTLEYVHEVCWIFLDTGKK